MQWIAPSEKDTGTETLESRLWAAADQLRANSGLTSAQYSQPVLGLIFLRFAEVRFLAQRAVLEKHAAGGRRGSRVDDPTAYQAEGILYLDIMAVTASAWTLSRRPPARAPLLGGLLSGALRPRAELRSRQSNIDLPSSYIVDYVSRLTASHSATYEEVGHGEP